MSRASQGRPRRLLYVDRPFASRLGGDMNRSRFLASVLAERYRADLLLLVPEGEPQADPTDYPGFGAVVQIRSRPQRVLDPPGSSRIASADARRLQDRLRAAAYDVMVVRSASHAQLARVAARALPHAKIVVDCDMLLYRLADMAWRQNRSFRNRYHLLARIRLRRFEARFFHRRFLFLFSNPVERDMAASLCRGAAGCIAVLPNAVIVGPDAVVEDLASPAADAVLFFGSSSVTNEDAYKHLVEDVLPGCRSALAAAGLRMRVAGRFSPRLNERLQDPAVDVVGKVPDMDAEIRAARFVLLPLRVASGTRTRILEAGRWGKAVVTTPLGAEGLDLPPDALVIRESATDLAAAVSELAAGRLDASKIGRALREAVTARYSAQDVGSELCDQIESFEPHAQEWLRPRWFRAR